MDAESRRQGPVRADSTIDFAGGLPSIADDPTVRIGIGARSAPVSATFSI